MIGLAWRNVWRNRRRSLITVASIGAGLAAILFFQSMLKTVQRQLVEKATGIFVGHLQVLAKGVSDYKLPDKPIADPAAVERALAQVPRAKLHARRWIGTALASSKAESAGIMVCGVEPEKDRRITTAHAYLKRGSWLGAEPDGIFLGEKLAAQLGVDLGGEVVLMASTLDGSLGAERFRVVGVFGSGSHTFDASIAFVRLDAAQRLLGAGEQVNNFVARLEDPAEAGAVRDDLARRLEGQPVEALTWGEVDHELVAIQRYQDALMLILLMVVFLIVALGIVNTMLMSTLERVREFGVLRAMGARRRFVLSLVLLESCLLGGLGTVLGLALGCGLILYYGRAGLVIPIGEAVSFFMPFDSVLYLRFDWPTHAVALAAVALTSALSGLPAAARASKLRPAQAVRHV